MSSKRADAVILYDTTLRDGLQGEGMHLSLDDKLAITELLDNLGVAYIEGGWPGSNPRDEHYFTQAARLTLSHARLAAFGATRRAGLRCDDDPSIGALIKAGTPVITVFGKAWKFQATQVLGISPEENLELIGDTVRYLRARVDEVVFDAEHFFDGFADDPDYALSALRVAAEAGAAFLVLCDTNGGTLTTDLQRTMALVQPAVECPLGIHTHNDAGMAVANTVAAVAAGASMVQGTLNGYGERCGNADLIPVIGALELKMGRPCLPAGHLERLTHVAHTVAEITNHRPVDAQPYVGQSAFAHKGGVHADAVMKDRRSYEHVNPRVVGNLGRFLVSDLSGRASVCAKSRELGIDLQPDDPATLKVVARLKHLESQGYQFEGADASFKLLVDQAMGQRPRFFELHDLDVRVDIKNHRPVDQPGLECRATARIKLEVGGVVAEAHASSEDGPVHAIDQTLRKLIDKFYPSLKRVALLDYKVRVLSIGVGTSSVVRVLIRSGDPTATWNTVGVSSNIIEASWQAMVDALEFQLIRDNVEPYV